MSSSQLFDFYNWCYDDYVWVTMLNGWWWKVEGKEGSTLKNVSPIFSVFLFSFRMESNWNVLSEQPLERQPQKLMPTLERIWILNSLVLKVYTFCSYLSWPFVLSTMTTNRTNFLSLMIFNFSSLSVSRYFLLNEMQISFSTSDNKVAGRVLFLHHLALTRRPFFISKCV